MAHFVTGQQWAELFTTYRRSAWRYECQGEYHEPYEAESMRRYLAGQPYDLSYMEPWLQGIRNAVASGRAIGRVRVLTEPLTDYLRFEMSVANHNLDAGEDIRVLDARTATTLGLGEDDFWLFDDEIAALMVFGEEGFSGAYLHAADDTVDRCRRIRDRAWQHSRPFTEHPAFQRSA